jgi:ABC-type multidrug transport system ATPase subunit
METTIEVAGLRKRFGSTLALDGMTFTVSPGQITGFIGPNGAGKSTTMRVILGLDAPDAGHALIGGRPYVSLRDPLTQASALLGDPPALMFDEPFNGLDPEGTREMRGLLASLAAEGRGGSCPAT